MFCRRMNGGGNTVGDGENEGEGEQIPNHDVSDDSSPVERHSGDEVFDSWTVSDQKLGDTADGGPTQISGETIEIPTASPSDEFAENVDETLRLLSDET